VFYNALGYAVEQGHLPSNPIDRIQWTAPRRRGDRRQTRRGQPRPGPEAPGRRARSQRPGAAPGPGGVLRLPVLRGAAPVGGGHAPRGRPAPARQGLGRIDLAASASRAGTAWTDHGTARQERGLKHRAAGEIRTIPIPPELVKLVRAHIKRYGTTPDGRIFQTARGGLIQDSAYSAVWAGARKIALTEPQFRSPLGRRPYDLRHAAVSLWLNSGVPATEVARRLGPPVLRWAGAGLLPARSA
jgi:hypothetical protein